MADEKELYVAEMKVWLEQENCRAITCRNDIELLQEQIRISRNQIATYEQFVALERQQIELIDKRRLHAAKELEEYLAKQKT